MKKPLSLKVQQQSVEIWNLKHPVNTPVVVRMDGGDIRRTVTTSAAQMLSGHTAVIWLEGISGCYLLSRVTPIEGGA